MAYEELFYVYDNTQDVNESNLNYIKSNSFHSKLNLIYSVVTIQHST